VTPLELLFSALENSQNSIRLRQSCVFWIG
jgi:hypothetical protein